MSPARLHCLLLLLVGAACLWRTPARAVAAGGTAEDRQLGLVLYNDQHFHLVGLGGSWKVSTHATGSRLRPTQDFGTVQLMDLRSGEVLERQVPSWGELALAHGWIAVNTSNQATF